MLWFKRKGKSAASMVRSGAKYLDKVRPGWEERIDLSTLNVSNPFQCVLGQVFGVESRSMSGYSYAMLFMSGNGLNEEAMGFFSMDGELYPQLTEAWREEIVQRRLALAA